MIVKGLLELFYGLISVVFGWINLPDLPASVSSLIDELFSVFQSSVGLLGMVFDLDYVKVLLPVLLVVVNFERLYALTMFVLRKIPFLGVQ